MSRFTRSLNGYEEVGILISFQYGVGWSSTESNPGKKKEMAMNKHLVQYIYDCQERKIQPSIKDMTKVWNTHLSHYELPNMKGVANIRIYWIKSGSAFKIKHLRGAEYIFRPEDDLTWITV
jgi:hypothetical protein